MKYLIFLFVVLLILVSGCYDFREVPEKELPSVIVYENRSYEASGEYYKHKIDDSPSYVGNYDGAYIFAYADNDIEIFVSEKKFPEYYRIYRIKAECAKNEDCVAATCCHASECVPMYNAPDCSEIFCTAECVDGTMDCGQGYCACVNGVCKAVFE